MDKIICVFFVFFLQSEFRIRSRCVIDDKRRGMLKMCHIDANEVSR